MAHTMGSPTKMETRLCEVSSPLGVIYISDNGNAVTGLWFAGQKYERTGKDKLPVAPSPVTVLQRQAADWLREYFAGHQPEATLPLEPEGTAFQKRVWAQLRSVAYGERISYGELAERLGCKSARAVGAAVGRNPISLLIPCHRIVGAGGALTGYAGGLARKEYLLKLESGR